MTRCWPLLLLLTACAGADPDAARVRQCQAIAEHYSKVAEYQRVDVDMNGDEVEVRLAFAVPSALGPQQGRARCRYRGEQPVEIQLGRKTYTNPADIADLTALRSNWPMVEHDH